MYFDGSLMLQGMGNGIVLISASRNHIRYVHRLCFEGATTNVAEYEALLHRMHTTITLGVPLVTSGNSELMVNQVMKASICQDVKMDAYYNEVRNLKAKFDGMKQCHITQRENEEVDSLARLGST